MAVTKRATARMRAALRSTWVRTTIRFAVGGIVLIAVIAHVGTGPVVRGIVSVDARTISAALVLAAIATAAAAWRWRLIAIRLGVDLSWPSAIGMYYRSQFLNSVLPGGVAGDVHRAVAHGQRAVNLKQSARAVAIERTSGQAVQLALTVMILACVGAQFTGPILAAVSLGLGVVFCAVAAAAAASRRVRAALRREARELRAGLGSVRTAGQVALASVVVVACHVATFTIAIAAVGVDVPLMRMLPLALVVLLGASVPLNIGGWGPREGVAGWAFAVAGFGASAGVAASTLFGVLAFIAVAPGAVIALVWAVRDRTPRTRRATRDHRASRAPTPRCAAPVIPILVADSPEKSS